MSTLEAIRADIARVQAQHRAVPERMHGQLVPYFRRGEMSIPAFKMGSGGDPATDGRDQSLKLMKKAATLPIDFFFYDLEDAAPDNAHFKPFARQNVVDVLRSTDFGDRVVAFRPNNIRTAYFEEDVVKVVSEAGDRLQAMVIPKTEYAVEVQDIVRIIRDVQRLKGFDNRIMLEVLIESPRAFLEAEKIAAIDGVAALIFGAWDFARTIGGKVTADGWIHDQQTVRQMLPVITAAYGKEAVDAVTGTLPIRPRAAHLTPAQIEAGLATPSSELDINVYGEAFVQGVRQRERALDLARRDAWDSRACGYAAKWILHPDQITPIHSAWTPTRQDAMAALQLTADYARAAQGGSGAEVDGDRLADKAVIGTEWWVVRGAMKAGVLSDEDIAATGFTYAQLLRTVVTHDEHSALG
jgi:citrate lyase subunit beta/citryl-CoA lyase